MSSHRFLINYHTMIHYFLYSSDFQFLAQNYWRTKVRKESSPVECDDNMWLATFQPIMKWMECDRCVLGHVYAMLLLQAAFSVCKHGEVYEFIFCSPWSRQTSCRERFKYDSNFWAEPCSQYSHVECMRMQQLDIFIFWHERNVGAAAALFNQDKFVTTRISYNSHKSVAIIKIYVCNLIISGPNCSLSSLVFYSHIHLSSSSTTTATDVCPLFVHVFHNLFAST